MFPFPGAERMSEEERDTLEMMVDPADSVSIFTEAYSRRILFMIREAKTPYLNSPTLL